jgi:hypothetical protein
MKNMQRISLSTTLQAPNTLLLLAMCLLILTSPFTEEELLGKIVEMSALAFVFFAAVFVGGRSSRRVMTFGFAIGATWLVLSLVDYLVLEHLPGIVADLVFMAYASFIIVIMLDRVIAAKRVTADVLCGSASIYLLLAISWAVLYHLINQLVPGSFMAGGATATLPYRDMVYFSLCTITTIGYGDISPLGPLVRMLAGLEGVIGTFYIAVLVARLVGLYSR